MVNFSYPSTLVDHKVEVVETLSTIGGVQAIYVSVLVLVTAIVVHELGHYLFLRSYSPSSRIYFYHEGGLRLHTGRMADYIKLKDEQKFYVYIAGIVAGLIPIVLGAWIIHDIVWLVLPGYLIGSLHDMKLIWRLMVK